MAQTQQTSQDMQNGAKFQFYDLTNSLSAHAIMQT